MEDPYGFATLEQQYGLPSGYLARTAQIESGMNPNAQNPRSSAGGLFQFIDSTAGDYGLTNRMDPYAASDAAARLARDNASFLRGKLGRDPTASELYLAHQQGAGGAWNLLSNPNASASSLVGQAAVSLNGGRGGATGADFARHVENYYSGGNVSNGPAGAPVSQVPQNQQSQQQQPPMQNALAPMPQQKQPQAPQFRNAMSAEAFMNPQQNALQPFGFTPGTSPFLLG